MYKYLLLAASLLLFISACKQDSSLQNKASSAAESKDKTEISIQSLILKDSQEEKPENLRYFYYPIDRLTEPLVYHYVSDDQQLNDRYVVLTKIEEEGKTFLTIQSFFEPRKGYFIQYEFTKEEINNTGAYIRDYKEFQYDKEGNRLVSSSNISKGESMLWELEKEAPLVWEYDIENKMLPDLKLHSKRTRIYNGDQMDVDLEKLIVRSLLIRDSYENTVKNETQGLEDNNSFLQMSCYALGIGKFNFVQNLGGKTVKYSLSRILTLEEWEALKLKK